MLRVKFESETSKVELQDTVLRSLLDSQTKVERDVLVAKWLEKEDIEQRFSGLNVFTAAFVEDLYKTKAKTFDNEDIESALNKNTFVVKKLRTYLNCNV